MRIIQKRKKIGECQSDLNKHPNINFQNFVCTQKGEETSDYLKNGKTYKYKIDSNDNKHIYGRFGVYDNSGFIADISLLSGQEFKRDMDFLINSNWVDEDTLSVIIFFNMYSINNDLFVYFRILWENQTNNYYRSFPSIGLLDITPITEYFSIICIVLSVFLFAYKIFQMKKSALEIEQDLQMEEEQKKKEKRNNLAKKNNKNEKQTLMKKFKNLGIIKYIKKKFRIPTMIETICK